MNNRETIYMKAFELIGEAFSWSATDDKTTSDVYNYIWGCV